MGKIKWFFRKIIGNDDDTKQNSQLFEIINFIKMNENLRNRVLESQLKIYDLSNEIITYQDQISILEKNIEDLNIDNNNLREDILIIKGGPTDKNPTREAVFSILMVRPKVRNKTIAEILQMSERTVFNYRKEYRDSQKNKTKGQ